MKKLLLSVGLFCATFCMLAVSAAAYLDPSSMTYIIQAVAAVVIAGGAAIAIFWKKIRLFFKNRKSKKATAELIELRAQQDGAATGLTDTEQGTIRVERRGAAEPAAMEKAE